jgi:hypothetical protein
LYPIICLKSGDPNLSLKASSIRSIEKSVEPSFTTIISISNPFGNIWKKRKLSFSRFGLCFLLLFFKLIYPKEKEKPLLFS